MSKTRTRTGSATASKERAREAAPAPRTRGAAREASEDPKLRSRAANGTAAAVARAPGGRGGSRRRAAGSVPLPEWPIEDVWREYKRSCSDAVRNFLIEHYLDLVKYTAERMHMRLPGEVDVEDLMQAGLFGLMDAIDAFDLERGVKFETYCTQRIRGAIFDELRAMDWVPRLVRSRTARVDRARKGLEMELGRKATDKEICDRLNVDRAEYQKLSKDSRPVGVISLDRKWFETDSNKDIREIDVIKDTKQENPVSEIQHKDLKFLLTKGLSRAERLIVILYYYEEMTMKEIGMTLDLSESRVSQMHSSILARLKAQMRHREREF
jgi:RNA polymerase sigma factor for flagellar operon FliA